MIILGIETSCDETSAALVEDGKKILSNVVYSQAEIHKKYDGVVPEIASRNHLEKMLAVMDEALAGAPKGLGSVDAVAVTNGPGLIGSLLIGLSTAKAVAYTRGLPLVPVNHIEAHMYAPHLFADIPFPYIGLVVSGGHTLLFNVSSFHEMEMIGSTIDDAIGEAYDKVAKLLGLGYPGGPVIDKLAKTGNPDALPEFRDITGIFPDKPGDRHHFSYSGLKTAIAYRVNKMRLEPEDVPHVAAAFQRSAIEMLVRKTRNALEDTGINRLVISGGVAANSLLRAEFDKMKKNGTEIFTAPVEYCGDNASMVAGRGYADLKAGRTGGLRTDAYSRLNGIRKGKRIGHHGG